MAYQRVPGSTTGVTPAQLLAEAQTRPPEQPVNRLEALLLVDAARWVAWPQPAAGADELEARIAAQPPSDVDSAPGRLLQLDLAAREASAHGSLSQAADALNALPSGYSVKSLWLRWRETFGRHRRAALWDRTRAALAEAAAADGVPASETLAALLGSLDLPRWRAQTRLQAEALAQLAEPMALPKARLDDSTSRVYQASAGRWQLMLGDEVGGARRLHAAVDGLALTSPTPRGRLFSRPAPDSAVWLRQAVDLAQRVDGEPRESLLLHALCSLIGLALRHTSGHLLAETLDPRPVRFDRPDATALVLAQGASAWLFCGEVERHREWWRAAHKLALRHARSPLILDVVLALAAYHQRLGGSPVGLDDIAARLAGDARLEASIELARVRAATAAVGQPVPDRDGDLHRGRQALAGLYRLAKTRHHAGHARAVSAIGAALCDLGLRATGFTLFALMLQPGAAMPSELPTDDDEAEARAHLAQQIEAADGSSRAVPDLLRSLALCGEPTLATALLRRAVAAGWPTDGWARLTQAMALSQAVAEGCDPGLPAAVDSAVREETQRVTERLRIDDPVFDKSATTR